MEVLSPAAALDILRMSDASERTGLFASPPAPTLVVAVDASPETARVAALASALPCVTVGISKSPVPIDGFDLLLTSASKARRPWVSRPGRDLAALTDEVLRAVAASPQAAVALVQLLRLAEALPVHDALRAESFVYGLLQSGKAYKSWLERRPPECPGAHEEHDFVSVERADGRLEILLDRPEVRNAYGIGMRDGLVQALRVVADDPAILEVHLRARGPAFCAGGDLREFGTTPDPVTGHLIRSSRSAADLLAQLTHRCTAHLHGACVGAGIELPAFCGRVLAAPGTAILLPEVGMGLIPGAGGTVSIARRVGRHRLAWLAISGAWLDLEEALDWGLVDEVELSPPRA